MTTPWDAPHLAYFSGYAMWTYLTAPFLLNLPGFQTQEIEPWDENGETWRRLKAIFPPNIPSHGREQIFYFDVIGGSSSANYALEPKTFGGIVYPTKRRVYEPAKSRPRRHRHRFSQHRTWLKDRGSRARIVPVQECRRCTHRSSEGLEKPGWHGEADLAKPGNFRH